MRQPSWRAIRQAGHLFTNEEPFWTARQEAFDLDCREAPPAETGGDPARIALWRSIRDRSFGELDRCLGAVFPCTGRIVEVTACGVREFFACERDGCGSLGRDEPRRVR